MELCISNLPQHRLFSTKPYLLNSIKTSIPLKSRTISQTNSGLHYFATPLRAEASQQNVVSINEHVEEVSDGVVTMDEDPAAKQNVLYETKGAEEIANEIANEDPLMNKLSLAFDFLDGLNVKDSSDTYSVLVYGSSALVSLWLTSAIIGALDSIPVVPKVLELVGLAFTIWFSSRYLIFKKNRDELSTKIEELKQQIIGSKDD